MARLPVPGSDNGQWGAILNEFLQQSHADGGGLKAGSVGTDQLQNESVTATKLDTDNAIAAGKVLSTNGTVLTWADASSSDPAMGGDLSGNASTAQIIANAVTTAKVADGAITASKLAPGITGSTATGLRSLLIFYAAPNVANGQFNDDYAAGILSRYDDVVLGTGLEDPGSPYYASTSAIIGKVAALSPETVVWGYIDAGVSTGNLSMATLQTQIDQWIAIGARGIFCDVIGYAYLVPRSRQNAIIDYIHSKGVGAILNVFNPDEVLSPAVDPTYNPTGTPTTANATDVLLLESWICNSDAYSAPYYYATFSDIKTRADKAVDYRESMGIRIFGSNIYSHSDRTFEELKEYRDYTEAFARVWRLDGSGIAASSYSSTGLDVGVVTPQFSSFRPMKLQPNAPYVLNGPWTQVQAPDLGIMIVYDGATHTWSQR